MKKFLDAFSHSRIEQLALLVLLVLVLGALAAPLISPQNPYDLSLIHI